MRLALGLALLASTALALPPRPGAAATPVTVAIGPDGGPVTVTCTNCSGGSGGGSSLVWIDGGRVGADVLSIPAIYIADGGVNIENWPATNACTQSGTWSSVGVTGSFWQSIQPVSGTVTANQGTGPDGGRTLDVSGSHVVVDSAPVTHTIIDSSATLTCTVASTTITGTATVAGTVTSNQGTGPDGGRTYDVSGSHVVVDSAPVTHAIIDSSATLTCTGPATDTQLRATPLPISGTVTCSGPLTDTQIRATALPVSGTVTASVTGATLAAGSAVIGHVIVDASAAVIGHVINDASSAVIGHVIADTGSTTACTQATGTNLHTVVDSVTAGTVTCNAGTNLNTSTLALDATLTAGTVKTKIVDTGGSTAATVKAASTAAVATDTALVVAQAPTGGNPCQNPSATIVGLSGATSGTASVQLVAISGSTKVYVCSLNVTGVSGTTPTFKLQYGTGSVCGTGTVGIIGPFTSTANTVFSFWGTAGVAVTPAGQALCYVQTGSSPISNYNLTYVQL